MKYTIPLLTRRNIALAVRQMQMDDYDNIQEARRKIIARAKDIHAEELIPGNWNEDGTLK